MSISKNLNDKAVVGQIETFLRLFLNISKFKVLSLK